MTLYLIAVFLSAALVVVNSLNKSNSLTSLIPSAFWGVLSLFALKLGTFLGLHILAVNLFTLFVAVFLGVPGVVALSLLSAICQV